MNMNVRSECEWTNRPDNFNRSPRSFRCIHLLFYANTLLKLRLMVKMVFVGTIEFTLSIDPRLLVIISISDYVRILSITYHEK